ncbi:MAG: hypothetical protein ABNH38_03440 [Tateyamaria sp.]|jgi:hypothetical protein|uniref:hypothetical protein n=1 Tax=unclassified Tateyamaria TaxID=2645127 RepID=UPI00131F355B|nr:hypothetical protein [Tateyamaria sp. Alg231-49]
MKPEYKTSKQILEIYELQAAFPVGTSVSDGSLAPTYKTSEELLREIHRRAA